MAEAAAILSFIIALFRRGRPAGLADLFDNVRHFWLVLVPFVMVIVMSVGNGRVSPAVWLPLSAWLHVIYSVALVAFFAVNLNIRGMWSLLLGQGLNMLPILANGGKMPISVWAGRVAGMPELPSMMLRHVAMSSSSRFNWLGDFIPIPVKLKFLLIGGVLSPGDVFIAIGLFVLIQCAMCPVKKKVSGAQNA